jgi:DNA-binding GntR family transcriptional regulator
MLKLTEKKSYKSNSKTTDNKPAMVTVIKRLTDELAVGEFKSGQSIKESVLAKKYGVSRNAIREALNQIVGWGLFEYVPYKGYQVKKFTVHNLLQWDELREALEPIAARRLAKYQPDKALELLRKHCKDMEEAYENMDEEAFAKADYNFHSNVIEYCGNSSFSQLQAISNLAAGFYFSESILNARNIQEFRYSLENFNKEENIQDGLFPTLKAHREMSEAIFSGDAMLAEETFRKHARCQVKKLEQYVDIIKPLKQ